MRIIGLQSVNPKDLTDAKAVALLAELHISCVEYDYF